MRARRILSNQKDMEINLREAKEQEAPEILRVMQAAFLEYNGVLDPPSGVHHETVESVKQKLQTGNFVLAEINYEIVGCVFYENKVSYVDLGRLSVIPQHRRQGIGRMLIDYVEQKARQNQIPNVRLGVRMVLVNLRRYYEGLGYKIISLETHAGYAEPTYVLMEKAV
jgi:ribosomal protein S18 acetylase RimI-like enzyme